ncbi:MAG: metal ABC transporter ATP-binding protein [Candidatus Cloacimonetes bacterium]|nr:metal ABC transporter ATP-binding protein [Candidatus Cloacimonadota bacterium]
MIEIQNLDYSIKGKSILEDINLTIPDGQFVAIIGPNGAGKSSLIKILLGIWEIQKGEISIDGISQAAWLKANSFGYLPQHEEFDRSFPATAMDIVLMGLAGTIPLAARLKTRHKEEAMAALDKTGVAHLAKDLIAKLSGGEFQRVLLARAIVSRSKYLILDEPEASLDRPSVQSFFTLLKSINETGHTIITISHDLNILSEYCSFLVCLNHRLHCHNHTDLVSAEIIRNTFGESVRIIEKDY